MKQTLRLTNGEVGMLHEIAHFLRFAREEGPIPESPRKLRALLMRYVKAVRQEQMEYVNALRIERGQPPLPAKLLRRNRGT